MKIRPVKADIFHADGQRDMRTDRDDEANNSFSQFLRTLPTNQPPCTLFNALGLTEGGSEYFGSYIRHLVSESNPKPPV